MNPFTLHQSEVIREIYRELGREEESEERVRRWYELRDTFGSPEDPHHQRVRLVKQYARSRIYEAVFDSDPEATRLFGEKEVKGLLPAVGLETALERLKQRGTQVAVVSEVTELQAVLVITSYLAVHGLKRYFNALITPAGLFTPDGELVDEAFVGATKKAGTIYEKLKGYLSNRGISSSDAVMVGDDPLLDVEHAKLHGFVTVQYVGIVDRGRTPKADYVIDDWSRLPTTL